MSTNAFLLAIGPYSTAIADCLEYQASLYVEAQTPPGSTVFGHLFPCQDAGQSEELARVLGVGMWAFTEHEITAAQVSPRTQTAEELEDFELEIGLEGELDRLQRLLAAGFRVYYRPNG